MPALKADDGVQRFWRSCFTDARGREYEGYVNERGQWDGPGIAIYPSGSTHEGYWRRGKLEGNSRSIWPASAQNSDKGQTPSMYDDESSCESSRTATSSMRILFRSVSPFNRVEESSRSTSPSCQDN